MSTERAGRANGDGPTVPVSVIVPTRNEERNLRDCLGTVRPWAAEVIVLDSFSNDRTVAIAEEMGAAVAQRRFDTFSAQKNWALDHLPLAHEWVLFLDADERIPAALWAEIRACLAMRPPGRDGYYLARQNFFMGRWVRHGGWYPNWQLRLFRHALGRYEDRIVHEHILLAGRAGYLRTPLVHRDDKGLERYFERHNVYSSMEAVEVHRLLGAGSGPRLRPTLFTRGPGRRRWLKELAYRYLPGRPLCKFAWMYLGQGGFLDGRVGFRYCLLQSLYEYQISLKLRELRTDPTSPLLARYAAAAATPTAGAPHGNGRK